ncbi:multivesicular body subunit 12A isoform X1 [Schistocerca americana]|uniref:multivesicular body subunit 12A isoform X1 n=1 Tax=Schistocerca americana TaxID=7009 RepID=UPI001F501791|nr:multivesicular body subunit 12A isoform X1 [Schistocerca americana]XP_046984257.1 multivesicular body subunit 12A isoform X1 [Schistocerca americana]
MTENIKEMMQQLYQTLPDDRPITSIQIVEDADKCPPGFTVVSRTHDQDSDADLWREAKVFGRKVTRYVCHSKTEGIADYIVESVLIINEREVPPDGYSVLTRTADTDQRAWRKRQLCYRLAKQTQAKTAVTDIIVLSRLKKAPDGFSLAGDINGMTVCFKMRFGLTQEINKVPTADLFLSLNAGHVVQADLNSHSAGYPLLPQKPLTNNVPYPVAPKPASGEDSPHEYERLINLRPSRPAPKPPGGTNSAGTNYATLSAYQGLEGVPFVLNPGFNNISFIQSIPSIKAKTRYQLDQEFDYDFRIERQT